MPKRKNIWGIFYALLLLSFTIFLALDTFVIKHVYKIIPYEQSSSNETTTKNNNGDDDSDFSSSANNSVQSASITVDSYKDENISISLKEYRQNDTNIYVADITVASADYLKTAFAKNTYGRNVTDKTSEIAEDSNAILAINGDFYGARESGYVIRNGELYRNEASKWAEDLAIYSNGSFKIISESEISAEELLGNDAKQVFSFGPALVDDGKISVTTDEEVGKAMVDNPRTAIGIIDELHYTFVVSDGRTEESKGLTLYELAQFMQGLGVKTAYNMDGGGSSTMIFNGTVINNPTTSGKNIKERSVSDIVYIGY